MQTTLKLYTQDLSWLGQVFDEKFLASPLTEERLESFTETDKERLAENGVIKEDGTIEPEAYALLDVLAKPETVVDIILRRGPFQARQILYRNKQSLVSAVYEEDRVLLAMPPKTIRLMDLVEGYFGKSSVMGCNLSVQLDDVTAMVFLVLIDHYRRASFKAMAEEKEFLYTGAKQIDIQEGIDEIKENVQSLAYQLFLLRGGYPPISGTEVEESLQKCLALDLVSQQDGYYVPIGEAMLFAGSFLVLENFLSLVVGTQKDEELYRSHGLIIQAGPIDLIYMESTQEGILLECISSKEASSLLAEIIHLPADVI